MLFRSHPHRLTSMSLKQLLILGCLLVFIAPSFQYGTIFTDNVKPAFSDRTYFSGIKSEEVLTTDASIGVIGSNNLAGFSINSPGVISSTADTHSFTSSQIVEFTASEVLNVLSAGTLSVATHRTDVDADSFSFAGEGDASLNGLSSTIRANYFELNTTGNAAIRSTGDELLFNAPVFVGFAAVDNATVIANNNVVFDSDASFIDYSGQHVLLTSNYFSANGDLATQILTNQFTMEAAAIVDLSSLTSLYTTAFRMDLVVDSGDINIVAPSAFRINGADSTVNETYTSTFQSSSNLHLDSKGSTASIIQFDQTSEVQIFADNTITFGTFFGESGFTIDSDIDLKFTATDISHTVARAQYIAADSLKGTASNTVYISVPSEDLFVKTAVGDISFTSNRNDITFNTQDELVASALHTHIETLDDIYINSKSALFQQNNPDSESGILRIDVLTQTVLNGTVFEITSAGTNQFNAGLLYYATGLNVEVVGNKAVDNILFATDRQTSIAAIDTLTYEGEHITISASVFSSEIDDSYRLATYDLEVNAEDISVDAQLLTINSVRDAIVFNTQSIADLNAQSLHHIGYNIEFINPSLDITATATFTINADSNISWNSANNVAITSPSFSVSSVQATQILSNTFSETAPTVSIIGKTIYQSQNLPSDTLQYTTGSLAITADYFDILSGGDVNINNSVFTTTGLGPYTIYGSASVNYNIGDDLTVLTNAASTFDSAGELNFQISGAINFVNNDDVTITGPTGENAFVSFHTTDIAYDVDFTLLQSSDVLISAGSVEWNADNFSLLGVNQWGDLFINSEDSTVDIDAAGDISIRSTAVLVYHAEDVLDIQAGNEFVIDTSIYDVIAPIHTVDAGKFDMIGTAGTTSTFVFSGTSFQSTVSLRSDIEGTDSASFYSGNTLDFNIENDIIITSDSLIIDGFSLVEFFSANLTIDTSFETLNIVSGGSSDLFVTGNLFMDSAEDFFTESFTTRATVGGDTFIQAGGGELIDNALDGVIHYISQFDSISVTAGEDVLYESIGNIEVNSQATFTANGAVPGTTTSIELETTKIDGNIVFQTESGDISISAVSDTTISSDGFGSVTAALGVTYDVDGTLDGIAGENIDVKSFAHTTFETTTFATYLFGDSATFEAGRNTRFTSDESTDLTAATEFTVSTGEQGDLNIYSASQLSFLTTGNQDYHSSGDYTWTASDNFTNDATKDIDLHTTGGPILFKTNTGDIFYDIGNNFNWRSGEDLYYDVDGDYTLSSSTNIQSLAEKGDITIDASSDLEFHATSGDITLLSLGNRNKNVPFEDIIDGITLSAFDTSFTFTSSFGFFPGNVLHFGGQSQPDMTISASGSTSTTGFTLDSDGHVSFSSVEDTDFTQVNLFINSREFVHFTADETLAITSVNTLSAKSDAGNIRFYSAKDFSESAETSITDTATGGYFLFTNNNKDITVTTELSFESTNNNVVMSANLLTEDIDELFHGTIGDIILTITNAESFTTTQDDNGSLEFSSTTGALSMSAKGSITGQVTGPGGAFRVDAGSLSVTTLKSSDITLHTAGRFESFIKTTATYKTTTGAVAIESLSVDGADYTQGDIHIKSTSATGDISLLSADTTDITADGSIYLNSTATTLDAIDILYESFDDTILFGESYSGTTALLFMGNTDGNGGNINMVTGSYYQTGTITWDITDDLDAKFAGNVIGYSEGTANFLASTQSSTSSSFSLITTLKDADIYFSTDDIAGTLSVDIQDNTEFDITSNIKTVSGLFSEYISRNSIDFTSTTGNVLFNTTRSGIQATASVLADFYADTSIITIEANGISPDSNYAINIYGAAGAGMNDNTILVSANKQLNLLAYEGIEFRTNFDTVLGSPTFIDYVTVTTPSSSKTTFVTTGLEANILFNTRVPEDGIVGSLSIVGTPIIDVIVCQPSSYENLFAFPIFGDSGVVDFVASETIRFEQVSGLSFEGRFGDFLEEDFTGINDCAIEYGTALNTWPSDAFFYSQGDYAGIEISTSAGYADIEFQLDTIAVFDADQELILGSTGETTSFVELSSVLGAVNFQVLSTNASDAIEVHAYNGRIYMDANNYGNILFVPQNNIYFTAVRGIELESNYVNAAAANIQFISRSGHINVVADNILTSSPLLVIGLGDVGVTPDTDAYYGDIFISATTSTIATNNGPINILSNGGDIRFDFGRDADFSGVNDVFFTRANSLRLPMKEESITPGTECQVPSQVAIAHNSFYSDGFGQLEGTKDTGIMICWCSTSEGRWYCRTLSPALPYN